MLTSSHLLNTLILTLSVTIPTVLGQTSNSAKRLEKNNAALLIVDHQVGLFALVQDISPIEVHSNIVARAAIGRLFDLPTVITTSAETGPNGPIPKEILQMHPNATVIRRSGEVDAWHGEDCLAAVRATGKQQFIVAGIITDVCVTFLSLTLAAEGYDVFVDADASGTTSSVTASDAKARMRSAGVQVLSQLAVLAELMGDWRSTPGALEIFPWMDRHVLLFSCAKRVCVGWKNG